MHQLKDEVFPIVDPTPDKLYASRKRKFQETQANQESANSNLHEDVQLPKGGWGKNLNILPEFNDINIQSFASKSKSQTQ